jgi:hypothetical protein
MGLHRPESGASLRERRGRLSRSFRLCSPPFLLLLVTVLAGAAPVERACLSVPPPLGLLALVCNVWRLWPVGCG